MGVTGTKRGLVRDDPGTAGERSRSLRAGEYLFRQGDPATAVFFVEQGRLRLERQTYDGKLVPIHVARAGETFAEAALFATRYHCDAVALEADTRVRPRAKTAILEGLGADPTGIGALVAAMARQLHDMRRRLELWNVRSARERVLLALDLHPSNSAGVVTIEGPLQDFAAELGLTRETLYRTLAGLQASGHIQRDGVGSLSGALSGVQSSAGRKTRLDPIPWALRGQPYDHNHTLREV